jgi:hypothetical protein
MTNTASSAAIAAEIETLRADLRTVNAAIDVLGKPAIAKAADLETAILEGQERYATALADEAEAARKLRLSEFSDISVTVSYPNNADGNLLRAGFIIDYTKLSYDYRLREAVPTRHRCNGFTALPDDAYEYLVFMRPEAIPAEIMALAPGDPRAAFSEYFTGQRRGMFRPAMRVDNWAGIYTAPGAVA